MSGRGVSYFWEHLSLEPWDWKSLNIFTPYSPRSKFHDYFEGVREAIWGNVIQTKLPHLVLASLKASFTSTELKVSDLICIFKCVFWELCFPAPKKNWTHQTLEINSRHNKVLQCLPTAFNIKSQPCTLARKASLYDSETFSTPLCWANLFSQACPMTYVSQVHRALSHVYLGSPSSCSPCILSPTEFLMPTYHHWHFWGN